MSYPGLFILAVVVLLPLTVGDTVLAQWGWLTLREEGLRATLLIVGRFLSILTLGFILLGTPPFLTLLHAMRSLGLPTLLADMTLLSYRYLFEIAAMLATMQQAMRLRGYGYGAGSTLGQSANPQPSALSWGLTGAVLTVASALVMAELGWR